MDDDPVVESLMAAVDWLTVTTKSPSATYDLIGALMSGLGDDVYKTTEVAPWRFQGFTGSTLPGAAWGLRGDEGIVIVSGTRCAGLWARVAPKADYCSRIDLAVTAGLEKAHGGLAARAYEAATEAKEVGASYIVNSKGGSTCYLGSRTSRYFGRLYDKSAEQGKEPGHVWRYEVECKRPVGYPAMLEVLHAAQPSTWILAFVFDWFLDRGVSPIWARSDAACAMEIEARVSSAERSLLWLSTQVQPTIQRLVVDGYVKEVYEALRLPGLDGLSDNAQEVL